MKNGDLYKQQNPQIDYVVDKDNSEKTDTDYDALLGVEGVLQSDGDNDQIFKVAKKL